MQRPFGTVCFLALLAARAPAPLRAQAVGLQVGVTSFDGFRQPEFGVRVSPAGREVLGVDFSFVTYPRFLIAGLLAGVADVGLAGRVRLSPAVSLVGRGGGSALVAAGQGGAAVLLGPSWGAGIVLTADERTTVRLDFTGRRLRETGGREALPVSSVTFGFLVHH